MVSLFNNTANYTKRVDGPLLFISHDSFHTPGLSTRCSCFAELHYPGDEVSVFQHSDLHPIALGGLRVLIGFLHALLQHPALGPRRHAGCGGLDTAPLTLLGLLGVASYAVAAWGLLYTSVTHYILIYSLMPSFTVIFSWLLRIEERRAFKVVGIVISLAGCVIAIGGDSHELGMGSPVGDALVLLFTMMMAGYIVLGSGVAARVKALPANTLMFGSSSLPVVADHGGVRGDGMGRADASTLCRLTSSWSSTSGPLRRPSFFRYLSLRSLSPITVGVYHNLVPVLTIAIACVCFGETLEGSTIVGGLSIIAGAELVRRGDSLGRLLSGDWQIARDLFTSSTGYRTN